MDEKKCLQSVCFVCKSILKMFVFFKYVMLLNIHHVPISSLCMPSIFNNRILISAAEDGSLFTTVVDFQNARKNLDSPGVE